MTKEMTDKIEEFIVCDKDRQERYLWIIGASTL
jgi:hypothetical protein